MSALLEENRRRFALHRILYDQAEQVDTIDRLTSEANRVFEKHANGQNEDELLNKIGTHFVSSIFNLKHPSFRGEDEWRILMLEKFDNSEYPVQYRVAGPRIVP